MNSTLKLFNETLAASPPDVKRQVALSFDIADRIDSILKKRNLSQKEFARMVGRSEAEVSRWVGGTHNFTISTIAKISAALDTDIINVARH